MKVYLLRTFSHVTIMRLKVDPTHRGRVRILVKESSLKVIDKASRHGKSATDIQARIKALFGPRHF